MKLPRRRFLHLAAGAGHAASPVAHRAGAIVSDASDPARGSVSSGRCVRRRRSPLGGQDQAAARHHCRREHRRRRQLVGAAAVARARPDGTRSCSAGRRRTSTRRCSRAGRSMIRSRTSTRLRASPLISRLAVHPAVPVATLRSSSLMRKPIPASCPTATPVSAPSSIYRRVVQIARGNAGDRAGALSGHWPGDHGRDRRTIPVGIVGVTGQVSNCSAPARCGCLPSRVPRVSLLRLSFRPRPNWASPASP